MAENYGWLLEVPNVAKTYARCTRELRTTQKELVALVKRNPSKANALKKKLHSCLMKAHHFLKPVPRWGRVVPKGEHEPGKLRFKVEGCRRR